MFEKDTDNLLYTRENFSIEEKLYKNYISMRKNINEFENLKYNNNDPYIDSEAFKQGFIAGIKIMSSLLLDI